MGCLDSCNAPLDHCPTSRHLSPQRRVHSGVQSTFLQHSYRHIFQLKNLMVSSYYKL